MAMKQTRTVPAVATVLALTAVVTACLPQGASRGEPGGGDDGSVLSSLDGVLPEDQARASKLSYFLDCDSFREGGSLREKDGKNYIRFDGSRIENGRTFCALEIQAPQDGSIKLDDYEWFGRNGSAELKGLMYASNRVPVVKGAMGVKIFILYRAKDQTDTFELTARGALALADGEAKPTSAKLLQIECDGAYNKPGELISESGTSNALLKFTLSARETKGKSCKKISMVTRTGDKEVEWEAATDITLPDPKKGDKLSFPAAADRRYELKKKESTNTGTGTSTSTSTTTSTTSSCLNPAAGGGCNDHTAQAIAPVQSPTVYLMAKVEGQSAGGTKEAYFVGAGERGFGLHDGKSLTTEALLQSIKPGAGKTFNWYKVLPEGNPRDLPFDARFVSGDATDGSKADATHLQEFKPLHIAETWVHGFHELAALDDLNAHKAAHWFVTLAVKKDDATVATLIVSDKTKPFHSDGPITTLADDKKALFDLESFKQNTPTPNTDEGWAIWSVKGGSAVDATCTMEADYVRRELSRRHLGNLLPEGGDATLDACVVTREKFDQLYGSGHVITLQKIWIWGWYQLPVARP